MVTAEDIKRAVGLWVSKPSAYNKSVGTAELLCLDLEQSDSVLQVVKDFFLSFSLKGASSYASVRTSLIHFLTDQGLSVSEKLKLEERCCIIRFIIPKNGIFRLSSIDLVTCDFDNGIVDFISLKHDGEVNFVHYYTITIDDERVDLIPKNGNSTELSRIKELFLSKIDVWSRNQLDTSGTQSLCLVSQEDYFVLYNNLKTKYCESIRKIWKESTDPDKFIHEDVAIATYLILLWGEKIVKFVDLGCGNGLLVHILTSEGYSGHGVDVRSRKIWSSYPPSTILKEETIVPSPNYVFPDVDWVIGNHSDELTPWIPVISLLSSDTTNFFLLPCCAYEFSGVKYKRANSSRSQYTEYLDYIQDVCFECGFKVYRDRLKIPSTKRICLVSKGRSPLTIDAIDKVREVINRRCNNIAQGVPQEEWLPDFKPRDNVEKVRNCTQLDPNFVSLLLLKILDVLLVNISNQNSAWDCGIPTEIASIARQLGKDDLKRLKNECGGLQTFFRNHHFIFKLSEGKVTFRKPEVREKPPKAWKVKPCWFFENHPQSCPLDDQSCSFIHVAALKRPHR